MTQNTLFVTGNTLFVNQMTQNTLFYRISADGWKTYALGEHDPESLQDGRTSSEMRSPGDNWLNKLVLTYSQSQIQLWWRSIQKICSACLLPYLWSALPLSKSFLLWMLDLITADITSFGSWSNFQLMLIIVPTLLKIEELEIYYCFDPFNENHFPPPFN